jgi:hypothetical protein
MGAFNAALCVASMCRDLELVSFVEADTIQSRFHDRNGTTYGSGIVHARGEQTDAHAQLLVGVDEQGEQFVVSPRGEANHYALSLRDKEVLSRGARP